MSFLLDNGIIKDVESIFNVSYVSIIQTRLLHHYPLILFQREYSVDFVRVEVFVLVNLDYST